MCRGRSARTGTSGIPGLEGPSHAYDHGPRYALLLVVACLLLGSPPCGPRYALLVVVVAIGIPAPRIRHFFALGSKKGFLQNGDALNERKRTGKIAQMCRVRFFFMGGIPGVEGSNPGKEVPEGRFSPRV